MKQSTRRLARIETRARKRAYCGVVTYDADTPGDKERAMAAHVMRHGSIAGCLIVPAQDASIEQWAARQPERDALRERIEAARREAAGAVTT